MLEEEEIHGQRQKDHGSEELPPPVKGMMTATSKIMTTLSRYLAKNLNGSILFSLNQPLFISIVL